MSYPQCKDLSFEKGFTVAELLVVLAFTAIMAATALPRMSDFREVMHRNNAEFQVIQHLRWLQAKAVEQGCRGVLKVSDNKRVYSMGCDYIPFDDSPEPDFDTLFSSHPLPGEVRISSDDIIVFNTRGQVIDSSGNLQTRTVTLSYGAIPYKSGTLRPTGFFDYDKN
jgi:Tfp pilus assembly protein FimT